MQTPVRRNSDCDTAQFKEIKMIPLSMQTPVRRNARPLTADNFRALIIITADRLQPAVCLPFKPRNSR